MEVESTVIPDVKVICPNVFSDARGFFLECWNQRTFAEAGLDHRFVQDNHSRSSKLTLRGLHYQVQHAQGKLVRAATGTIFDVAVDLRRSSPTFSKWVGVTLSDKNQELLWIPSGFAHGFLVLSDTADIQYKCTDFYAPEFERTIRWDDADLGIDWPLPIGAVPLLSARDTSGCAFRDADYFP